MSGSTTCEPILAEATTSKPALTATSDSDSFNTATMTGGGPSGLSNQSSLSVFQSVKTASGSVDDTETIPPAKEWSWLEKRDLVRVFETSTAVTWLEKAAEFKRQTGFQRTTRGLADKFDRVSLPDKNQMRVELREQGLL